MNDEIVKVNAALVNLGTIAEGNACSCHPSQENVDYKGTFFSCKT